MKHILGGSTLTSCDRDGMARIGLSPFELRGIRFVDGDDGAKPTDTDGGAGDGDGDGDGKGTSQEGDQTGAGDDTDPDPDKFDADKVREKIRKVNSENKNLRERAAKAEQQAKENAGSGEKVTALEAENLRLRVGLKHGLPEGLIGRLKGTTEEELLADAEELLGMFGGPKKPPTNTPRQQLRGGGDPTKDDTDPTADVDKFAEDVFRR
ncbi:hypothetical protein [Curtobacterium sp. MCBD17_003]|uniref:hypothetical protein n=1 Tax=Curtobacterium sp. MCBD17_003 TaxID=2175667 RepID=UPI000DAA7192|nr:hypothetical protein [Curtobacterium sp. MCBD17_003]WIE54223.1 hypothetical protein DEI88_014025 [Curtobacterium sp. MCBD17_003]